MVPLRVYNSGDKPMKKMIVVFAGLLFSLSFNLMELYASEPNIEQQKANLENGEKLFKKSRCLSCHKTDIFTRADRKIKNMEQLERQVRMCDSQLSINWFDDEIRDVASYLNNAYYRFITDPENALDIKKSTTTNRAPARIAIDSSLSQPHNNN